VVAEVFPGAFCKLGQGSFEEGVKVGASGSGPGAHGVPRGVAS
jgi:hypothetical protein